MKAKTLLAACLGSLLMFFSSVSNAQYPGEDMPGMNCRWVMVDWMGAGGGYEVWKCDPWPLPPMEIVSPPCCEPPPPPPPPPPPEPEPCPVPGTCVGGGAISVSPETQAKIIAVIKQSKDLCKKESEECGAWGARMTAPKPIGSGFCTNISAALPLIGTSLCIQAVNIEVNLNYCANVGCP
jgi:hypothetical protein